MQPQGPDSDHIKMLVNWVVNAFGQNAVCEALRVDAETLEAVLAGSVEASANFRARLARLIERADAAGLGKPPAMPDVPNTGPEVVSPGPGDVEVPSTPRTSGDHPVQKSGPARQPPVPSSPSPREALERKAEDRECLTLRRLYEELKEFEKSERLSCWGAVVGASRAGGSVAFDCHRSPRQSADQMVAEHLQGGQHRAASQKAAGFTE